jgi:hypothetical protein
MYVYMLTASENYAVGAWAVGFYGPDGAFHIESTHGDKGRAAARVHWLNGGNEPAAPEVEHSRPLALDIGHRYR